MQQIYYQKLIRWFARTSTPRSMPPTNQPSFQLHPAAGEAGASSRARHASEGDDANVQHHFLVPRIHVGVLGACMPVLETQHVPCVQCSVRLHAASSAASLTVQCCSLLHYHTAELMDGHDSNQASHRLRASTHCLMLQGAVLTMRVCLYRQNFWDLRC